MAISDELHNLGRYRIKRALDLASKGEPDGISGQLLLAIGSRETGMRNIVSFDGGTDRGWLQISARWHEDWLRDHPGCPNGSWHPDGETALAPDHCPLFSDACWKAISILRSGVSYAKNNGVKPGERLRFAISAYNAGNGGAMSGYKAGDSDKYTTGGDYAADVLRRKVKIEDWLRQKDYL